LVKQSSEEEMTESGLYIPPTAQEKPHRGVVLAVGPGRKAESGQVLEPSLKEGDVVLFGKYVGTEIKVEDEQYLIMREEDVLGILKEDATD